MLVDAQTERTLGAALLGIEADEVVHLLLDAMAAGVSYKVIQRAVHIHPTVSELIPTLLASLRPLAAQARARRARRSACRPSQLWSRNSLTSGRLQETMPDNPARPRRWEVS